MQPKQSFWQYLKGETSYVNPDANTPTQNYPDSLVRKVQESLASNETSVVKGDPYSSYQPSGNKTLGNALGRYRVTEGELNTYGKRYLGSQPTSDQFLKSPSLQDAYMQGKIKYYLNAGYTPQQIADIHNRGLTNEPAPGSTSYQNPAYVKSFNETFNPPSVASRI